MFSWRTSRPAFMVIAHRGASEKAPENTIASFRHAIADGAHALELDVRLAADGRVVVIHDRTLGRTTAGRGAVEDLTSENIRSYSAGRWFHERFADERVPLLEEVLDLAGGRIGLNIELKYPSRRCDPAPLVKRCARILREFSLPESVMISSFHHNALLVCHGIIPAVVTGLLVYPPGCPTSPGIRKAARIGSSALIYSGGNIRRRFVAEARRSGFLVLEYTVNNALRYRRSRRMGVDGVITNAPARVLHYRSGRDQWT